MLITLATQHTTHLIGNGEQVPEALTHGFALAYRIGAGCAGVAALLTFLSLPAPEASVAQGRAALRAGASARSSPCSSG